MERGGLRTPPGSPRAQQPLPSNGSIKHVGFAGEGKPSPFRSAAEARSSLPTSQQQSQDLVKDVKQSVAELRILVKDAVSHREKCCTVLSSALAVSLALEQVIYSGPMTATRVKKLQRLSADTISNVTLAGHCVKAYGLQGRLEKYLKKAMLERPEEKFEQISQRLERLAEDAWDLTEDGGSAVRLSVHRGRAPTAMHAAGSGGVTSSGEFEPRQRQPTAQQPQPQQPQPAEQQQQQQQMALRMPSHDTILTRARLRRGSHLLRVRALLYITPDKCRSTDSLLGQVWWYITGQIYGGKLMVHDLASGRTEEIEHARRTPVMHVMHQDANGLIWSGHKYGSVRVWDECSKQLICAPVRVFHADVMCITSDEREGFAWVGSSNGGVRLLEAQSQGTSQGKVETSLVVILELRHPLPADRPLGRASTASPGLQSSPSGTPLSVHKQESKSFTALSGSQDLGRSRSAVDVKMEGKRAHGGSVICIAAHAMRVWTSGGSSSSYNLREWSSEGQHLASFDLPLLGPAQAMMMMRSVVHVTFPEDTSGRDRPDEAGQLAGQGGREPLATHDSGSSVWQLVTAHSNGQLQVWDPSLGSIKPVLRIGDPCSSCRDLIVCESMGLLCSAHVDGSLIMRILPAMDQRDFTVPLESSNITTLTSKVATIKAHRSALACAVGGSIGVISAGVFGSIMLWPEAEIRSLAEAQGFMLPEKPTPKHSTGQSRHERHLSTSRMLQRYYTPNLAGSPHLQPGPSLEEAGGTGRRAPGLSPTPSFAHSDAPNLVEQPSGDIGPQEGAQTFISSGSQNLGSDPVTRTQLGSLMSTSSQQGSSSKTKDSATELSSLDKEQTAGQQGLPRLQTIPSDAPAMLEGSSPWASGNFAETASNWLIDFKDLTFKKMIGEGSIGRVHLGKWQETDVAIKVLGSLNAVGLAMPGQPVQPALHASVVTAERADSADSDGSLANSYAAEQSMSLRTLEREVGIMVAIRHPNVVLFMGLCLDPPCMVTEFCARGSLYDVLNKARAVPQLGAQLDWTRRLNIALDAAKGMLQLHSHRPPILHRDLKSPNLLVDKHWRCKIADFNLSRVMETTAVMSSITANNPRWLAPEVITRQEYSKAADVFSFGIILWELLVWRLPWEELGPFQIMVSISERKLRPDIPPLDELPGGAFPDLPQYITLLEACWHEDPDQRPSFETIITSLRAMLESSATSQKQQRIAKGPDARAQQPVGTTGPVVAGGPGPSTSPELTGTAPVEASAVAAERRGPEHSETLGRPSSGPLDGFAIATSNPSDTRAIDGREGLQMALGHTPNGTARDRLSQPAVAVGRQSRPSLEQSEAQHLQALRAQQRASAAQQGPFGALSQQQPFMQPLAPGQRTLAPAQQQGPFGAAAHQQQGSLLSQFNAGPSQPQGPFGAASQQQQPFSQVANVTDPAVASQQSQGPFGQAIQQQQQGPRSSDLPPGPFESLAVQRGSFDPSSFNQPASSFHEQPATHGTDANSVLRGSSAAPSSPHLQSSLYTSSALPSQPTSPDAAGHTPPSLSLVQKAQAALQMGAMAPGSQQRTASGQHADTYQSEQQQQQQPGVGWGFDYMNTCQPPHPEQQQQLPLELPGWQASSRPSLGSPPQSSHRSMGGHSSVSSGMGPWQDPRFSLDTRPGSLSSRPASFDIITQQGLGHSLANAAFARPASIGSAGDASLPVARASGDAGSNSNKYVSPFAAMDPLAPFPSTMLSGELPEQVIPESRLGAASLGSRKWSPERPYVSPFLAAQGGPSPASSAGLSRDPSTALEHASPHPPTARLGSISLPNPVQNADSGQDIQPELLLRGGSYTRPDRVFSNDSAAPMESVPEGRSMSRGAGNDRPPSRPPQRAASNLSPLRQNRLPQSPEEVYAPLFATSRSGSGSGFPIGQLQPLHTQGSPYMSGRLPGHAGESGMQPSFMSQVGQSSSSGYLSGSASPQSLVAGRGISLPVNFHDLKFSNEGSPHSPAAAAGLSEQHQEGTARLEAPVLHGEFGLPTAPVFDAHFLESAPRSTQSSAESTVNSQLRPHLQQHSAFPGAASSPGSPHAHTGLLPSQPGRPMPIVQGQPQHSTVAGAIPDRLSFLPRTESIVSITRASSV